MKQTKKRNEIYGIFLHTTSPLTAEDVANQLKGKIPIHLATIYRALNKMCDENLLVKNVMQDKKSYFELKKEHHTHHLICKQCHQILDIDICPLKDFEQNINEKTGFEITDHVIELRGICKQCKAKESIQ